MSNKPYILHMLTAEKNLSPFDVNMAADAGWEHIVPYTNIEAEEVGGLIQDIIFSRSGSGLKHTGLFIGGRDVFSALDFLERAKESMFPPFQISAFVDPSGAFTTAGGMIAMVEKHLDKAGHQGFKNKEVLVLGGTGPVGIVAAMLAAQAGAKVFMISRKMAKANDTIESCKDLFGDLSIHPGDETTKQAKLASAHVVLATAAAGFEVMSEKDLKQAQQLLVAADVNAVPPSGVAGLSAQHNGEVFSQANKQVLGVGALAIGNAKYQAQHRLLKLMCTTDKPVYLHFEDACTMARAYAKEG
ncbi:MAG: NAD(P)-dependent methylenetetrahydromethanopterin dehydrogenase [Candidatus Oxydemutatoraceae bacterium WSBS_2016_MAG_OTU14]